MFQTKVSNIAKKTQGTLIIKEYPTASAHVGHFKALLNELMLKRNFAPDIVFVDYLNICASSRFKPGAGVNSYTYVKAIAEELRGFAVEFDLPVVLRVRAVRYDTIRTTTGLPPNVITSIKVDSVCGEGFVQVENDEITSESITILECN